MAKDPEKLDRYVLTIAAILGANSAEPGAEGRAGRITRGP